MGDGPINGRQRHDSDLEVAVPVLQGIRIDELVSKLEEEEEEGSDLHLKVGAPPVIRAYGML